MSMRTLQAPSITPAPTSAAMESIRCSALLRRRDAADARRRLRVASGSCSSPLRSRRSS